MHFLLRPHVRGARRVLQCVYDSSALRPRTVTRSFSSFLRLQAQRDPSADSNKPGQGTDRDNDTQDTTKPDSLPKTSNTASDSTDTFRGVVSSQAWINQFAKYEDEKAAVDGHLSKGKIPPGFRYINELDELPERLRLTLSQVELPFLLNDNPEMLLRTAPTPEQYKQESSEQIDRTSKSERDINAEPDVEGAPRPQDNAEPALDGQVVHVEQFIPRRNRIRQKRYTSQPPPTIPEWFLQHRVRSARAGAPTSSEQKNSASGSADLGLDDLEEAKLLQQIDGLMFSNTPKGSLTAKAGDSSDPPSSMQEESSSTTIPPVNFKDGRYFGEPDQLAELFLTVRGRMRNFVKNDFEASGGRPVDVNHITVNHGAKGAVFLLDELIKAVAYSIDGTYIRLDVQDLSSFFPVQSKEWYTSRAVSYDVYREVYGTSKRQRYFGGMLPENQDDQDMEHDMEGQDEERTTPVFAVAQLPEQFSQIGDMLRGTAKQMRALSVQGNDPVQDAIKSAARRLLSAPETAARPQSEKESAKNEFFDSSSPKDQTPAVVHVQNYRAIQENFFGNQFLGELVKEADRRNANGQRVMIIGTDYARDDSDSTSANILEEQDRRSIGPSSNILLTPCFPESKDERHLLADQELHIKQINARHLWDAIPKQKGEAQSELTFAGLKDGFWENLSESLAKEDFEALGTEFWDRVRVQRLAALVTAHQDSASSIQRAVDALAKSDNSKVEWARRSQPDTFKYPDAAADTVSETTTKLTKIRKSASRHEKRLLHGVIEPSRITTTFNDIHIPAQTINALQTLTTLSLVRPDAFTYGVLKSDRIPGLLLYGPPGTGKTLAAKAVARESGATMLEVSGADLNDMFVGEGEKNVQALFSLARKLSPCVVFLDEADAMFSARGGEGGGRRSSHRELLNQFLREWDGMSNDSGSAFLMVATNRPMDLDDAVLRRLPRRILVDLPTELDRLQILKIHLRNEQLASDVDLNDLASKTPFYSGSDLKNVAVAAALEAVREENEAKKKHDEAQTTVESEREEYKYPEKRTLTSVHFSKALEEISASISEDMSSLREIRRFDEQYGDRRARTRRRGNLGFKSRQEAEEAGRDTVKVRS